MRNYQFLLLEGVAVFLHGCAAGAPANVVSREVAVAIEGAASNTPFRAEARGIETLLNRNYAYLERFEGGTVPLSNKLRSEAESVTDRRELARYAERVLLTLADHHAITGVSFQESWAIVPSYADLWIVHDDGSFIVDAVRDGSPASALNVRKGDHLVSVDGVPVADAIAAFWADLGLVVSPERAEFAARVLAAGRRDRPRVLGFTSGAGSSRVLEMPNLYSTRMGAHSLVDAAQREGDLVIRINDSLGDRATIAAFDAAMDRARPGQRVVIDLRETPGGGNTTVARAILGWFVERPEAYQIHELPVEERTTGVPRQWIEQVLPRKGKYHSGAVRVLVGRWTGSMGEGLAIGFDAIGAEVVGSCMAGLLGAIYDHRLEHSDLVIKLPTERLLTVGGTPREKFRPEGSGRCGEETRPADYEGVSR